MQRRYTKRPRRRERIRVCNKCGTAHFGVGARQIEALVEEHDYWADALTDEGMNQFKDTYLGSRRFDHQFPRSCAQCGNSYEEFHDPHPEDEKPDRPGMFRWILVERRKYVRTDS